MWLIFQNDQAEESYNYLKNLAHLDGVCSNALFDELARWNYVLDVEKSQLQREMTRRSVPKLAFSLIRLNAFNSVCDDLANGFKIKTKKFPLVARPIRR